jgi:hypothetical protein
LSISLSYFPKLDVEWFNLFLNWTLATGIVLKDVEVLKDNTVKAKNFLRNLETSESFENVQPMLFFSLEKSIGSTF